MGDEGRKFLKEPLLAGGAATLFPELVETDTSAYRRSWATLRTDAFLNSQLTQSPRTRICVASF